MNVLKRYLKENSNNVRTTGQAHQLGQTNPRRCWCLRRCAFGFGNTSGFDPFLHLDDFRNDVPQNYLAGFPWHPHGGIETITSVLSGTVDHGDNLGNHGTIAAGDIQWMTAA